jgi:hypothetical protein
VRSQASIHNQRTVEGKNTAQSFPSSLRSFPSRRSLASKRTRPLFSSSHQPQPYCSATFNFNFDLFLLLQSTRINHGSNQGRLPPSLFTLTRLCIRHVFPFADLLSLPPPSSLLSSPCSLPLISKPPESRPEERLPESSSPPRPPERRLLERPEGSRSLTDTVQERSPSERSGGTRR